MSSPTQWSKTTTPNLYARTKDGKTEYRVTYRREGWQHPTSKGPFSSKRLAQDWLRAQQDSRRTAEMGYEVYAPAAATPMLREYCEKFNEVGRREGKRRKTIAGREENLRRLTAATAGPSGHSWLLDRVTIGQLDRDLTLRLLEALETYRAVRPEGKGGNYAINGFAPKTVAHTMNYLKQVHTYAIEKDKVIPPSCIISWPPVIVPDSDREYDPLDFPRLLTACGPRYWAPVYIAGFKGLRASEVAGISIEALPALTRVGGAWMVDTTASASLKVDVQLDFDYSAPPVLMPTKTKASRATLSFRHEATAVIADHLNRFGTGAQVSGRTLVFGSRSGRHNVMSAQNLWKALDRASATLGTHINPHHLRHLFASVARASGAQLEEVQAMMRHRYGRTTQDVYIHAFRSEVTAAAATVDAAFDVLLATGTTDAVVSPLFGPRRKRPETGSDLR